MTDPHPYVVRTESSVVGRFRTREEADKWADRWNWSTPTARAYVEDPEPLRADGTWTMSDTEFNRELGTAWESGMRHALAWLGLKQYGDVMAADNPHKEAE